MHDVPSQGSLRLGDGYQAALGLLQIGTGTLSLLMSLMLYAQAILGHSELLHPINGLSSSNDLFDRLIATYVLVQLTFGWIAGALQLTSGICCLRSRHPRLVCAASLVNLANFPHGMMSGMLMLVALRRAGWLGGRRPSAA